MLRERQHIPLKWDIGNSNLTGSFGRVRSERLNSFTAQRQKTVEGFERTMKEWEKKRPFQCPAVGTCGGAERSPLITLTKLLLQFACRALAEVTHSPQLTLGNQIPNFCSEKHGQDRTTVSEGQKSHDKTTHGNGKQTTTCVQFL